MSNLARTAELAAELIKRQKQRQIANYRPFPKQQQFHTLGGEIHERMLRAGNRVGKTFAGAAELTYHLTGDYPDWWKGRRFDKPIDAWAAGPDEASTRDGLQRELVGKADDDEPLGFAFDKAIPVDRVLKIAKRQTTANLIDFIQIKHKSGGKSQLTVKNYSQGWQKFQSAKIDVVWFDEEPTDQVAKGEGYKVYLEARKRTLGNNGIFYLTFTPLSGYSEVVKRFMEGKEGTAEVHMTWEDNPDLAPMIDAEKITLRSTPHLIEPQIYGIPSAGSGAVYPIMNDEIVVDDRPIPDHWYRIGGMDFGSLNHPNAFVQLAWDRDNDVVYVTKERKSKGDLPPIHALALLPWGGETADQWMPWAWGREGAQRDKGSGENLKEIYERHGLKMLKEHAAFPEGKGGESVEAGVQVILDRMYGGRFKVFRSCTEWIKEKQLYARDEEGLLRSGSKKKNDDLMDATRYALSMMRFSKPPYGTNRSLRSTSGDAEVLSRRERSLRSSGNKTGTVRRSRRW